MTLLRRPRSTDHTGWRMVRAALWAAAVAAAALVLGALPASAHANLERSDPPNGGMIAAGRTTMTLWYGEPVTSAGSSFSLQRTDGAAPPVPTTATLDEGGTVVHLTLPALENGTYTLTWAVTAADGHPTRGTVLFGAGFRPDGVASADTSAPDPYAVLLRLLDLGGSLVALGSLVVAGRVVSALGPPAPRLRRRVLTAGGLGAALALAGALTTPVLTAWTQLGGEADGVGSLFSAVRDVVLTSTWGLLWVARVALLLVAYVCLWRARGEASWALARAGRPADRWRRSGVAAAVPLALAVSVDAWSGHASTLPARSALTAAAAAAHVVAASVWAGGLVVLVVAVVPVMRLEAPVRRAVSPAVWRAFSPVAAVSVGVLVATGLYEAARHVGTAASVTDGLYGWGVLAKLGLLGIALALAGYNTLVVNDGVAARVGGLVGLGSTWRPSSRPLAVTVSIEAAVLVLATGVAAVMTSTPTAREVAAASEVTVPHSDSVDGLFVTAEAVPTGSRLRVVVRTEAVLRPMPWPVTGVDVSVADGTLLTPVAPDEATSLEAVEDGHYEASVPDPGLDAWTAQVTVHRDGRPDEVLLIPGSSAVTRPVTPLEAGAGALALLLLAGTTAAVAVARRRAGGGRDPDPPYPAHPDAVPVLEEASTR